MPAAPKTSSFTAKAISRGGRPRSRDLPIPAVLRPALARVAAGAALALPAPVLAGEWPDPSVIRVGDEHVAVTTTDDWAPIFRVAAVLQPARLAPDGRGLPAPARAGRAATSGRPSWRASAAATPSSTAPCRAADGAPGCAWAWPPRPRPTGPWRDAGRPLRCSRYGSIDPHPVRDERGRLHLLCKEDGNAVRAAHADPRAAAARGRAASCWAARGSCSATDRRWEGTVVEAPQVVRSRRLVLPPLRGQLLLLARRATTRWAWRASRRLLGPWRKRRQADPARRQRLELPRPRHGGERRGGRPPGPVPRLPRRRGPDRRPPDAGRAVHGSAPTAGRASAPGGGCRRPVPARRRLGFSDAFAGPLAIDWEWRLANPPRIETGDGLRLTRRARERRSPGRRRARPPGGHRALHGRSRCWTATPWQPGAQGGVASFRDGYEVDRHVGRARPRHRLAAQGRAAQAAGLGGRARRAAPAPADGGARQPLPVRALGRRRGLAAGHPRLHPRADRGVGAAGADRGRRHRRPGSVRSVAVTED